MVIFFCIVFGFATFAKPGILIESSPTIFNNIVQASVPILERYMQGTEFPSLLFPIVKNKDFATDMSLSNIKITEMHLSQNETELTFLPPQNLQFSIPHLSITLQLSWKIQSHKKAGVIQSGTASITIPDGSISILISLPDQLDGKLTLLNAEFKLESLLIEFDQTLMGGVYNWVVSTMSEKLKNSLDKEINAALNKIVSLYLHQMPSMDQEFFWHLNNWLVVNSTLLSKPLVHGSNLEFSIMGEFFYKDKREDKELDPPVDLAFEGDDGFKAYFSQFSLNSLSVSSFEHEPIEFSGSDLGVELNNDLLEAVFPGINEEFLQESDVEVQCRQTQYIFSVLEEDSVRNIFEFDCQLHTAVPIISVNIQLTTSTTLSISNSLLRGSFNSLRIPAISLKESHLKNPPDIENLKSFLNGILRVSKSIISSKVFKTGIMVPEDIQDIINDLEVNIFSGFLTIKGNPVVIN